MSTQDHDNQRYHAAAHAMQTGVKAVAHYEPSETTPASLRVGVNAAHVSMAALTTLLLDKGIITMDEYAAANADAMETEAEAYRQRLAKHLGGETKVTLARLPPDPQTVREIDDSVIREQAREIILSHAKDVEFMSIGEIIGDFDEFSSLPEDEFAHVQGRIDKQIRHAVVTVSWPDEQQPAKATGGELAQDPRGSFWADLDRHLENPEFRKAYVEQSLRLQAAASEQAQGGAAGRVIGEISAFLAYFRADPDDTVIEAVDTTKPLTVGMLRHALALLDDNGAMDLAERNEQLRDERDTLAARVAELEAYPALLVKADHEAEEADARAVAADARAVAALLRIWATEGVGVSRYDPISAVADHLEARFADRIAALYARADADDQAATADGTPEAGQVPLRQRPIPDQLDYISEKLAAQIDVRSVPRDAVIAMGAAVITLGHIVAVLRKQTAARSDGEQARDGAPAGEAAGRLAAFCNAWHAWGNAEVIECTLIGGIDRPLTLTDLDTVLAERDTLAERVEQAEAITARVTDRMREYDQHGSRSVNVRQVLNLLSPTWPDSNYQATPTGADHG